MISWVFLAFNLMRHVLHQVSRWLIADWSLFSTVPGFLSDVQIPRSSANCDISAWLLSGVSFTYIRNRRGLITEPWGVPASRLTGLEIISLILTLICLSVM